MAAFDIANFPDQSVLKLVGTIDNSTANPTVTVTWESGANGPYKQVDNTSGNDTLITEMFVSISGNLAISGASESMWLTGGAVVAGKTRQVSYTATHRGLLNSETNNPPTAGYSRNYKSHKNEAVIYFSEVVPVKDLSATFTAGTTTNTAEAGEDIEALDSVSLDTDGKLYEYHATNYPNLVGAVSSAYATGVTATYTTFGGVSTGHTGLTIGATQYAENTGTITETSSTTTTILGTAESATTIRIAKAGDSTTEFSDNEFKIKDNSDATKIGVFEASGITTATTRTYTLPDEDGTILTDQGFDIDDNVLNIVDNADNTKKIAFQASGITTATTRTFTAPDKDGTLATTDDVISAEKGADGSNFVFDGTKQTFDCGVATPSVVFISNDTDSQMHVAAPGDTISMQYNGSGGYDNVTVTDESGNNIGLESASNHATTINVTVVGIG